MEHRMLNRKSVINKLIINLFISCSLLFTSLHVNAYADDETCQKELTKICVNSGKHTYCEQLPKDPNNPQRYFTKDLGKLLGISSPVESYTKTGFIFCPYPAGTMIRYCQTPPPFGSCMTTYRGMVAEESYKTDFSYSPGKSSSGGVDNIMYAEVLFPSCKTDEFRVSFFEKPNQQGKEYYYTKRSGYNLKEVHPVKPEVRNKIMSVRVGNGRKDGKLRVCKGLNLTDCKTILPKYYDNLSWVGMGKKMQSFSFKCD